MTCSERGGFAIMRGAVLDRVQSQHGLGRGEKESITWSAREEFNLLVRLADVGFELHGEGVFLRRYGRAGSLPDRRAVSFRPAVWLRQQQCQATKGKQPKQPRD